MGEKVKRESFPLNGNTARFLLGTYIFIYFVSFLWRVWVGKFIGNIQNETKDDYLAGRWRARCSIYYEIRDTPT